jgi:hypothetical protein
MKVVEVDDEKKLIHFYEKRMAQEVEGDFLGEEFKGYVFRCVARLAEATENLSAGAFRWRKRRCDAAADGVLERRRSERSRFAARIRSRRRGAAPSRRRSTLQKPRFLDEWAKDSRRRATARTESIAAPAARESRASLGAARAALCGHARMPCARLRPRQ